MVTKAATMSELMAAIRDSADAALEDMYWALENVPADVLQTPALTNDEIEALERTA